MPPSMNVENFENYQNKSGSKGCQWSRLNAPGTQTPLSHPILKLGQFPFPIIGPLGQYELASQYESEKDGKFPEQKGLEGMQMVQYECPRHSKPSVSFIFGGGR